MGRKSPLNTLMTRKKRVGPGMARSITVIMLAVSRRNRERRIRGRVLLFSLTDCTSFVLMEDEGVGAALTADRNFEQAGFKALFR